MRRSSAAPSNDHVNSERSARIASVGYDPAAGPMERVGRCHLCGSRHLVEVSRSDRYGYATTLAVCARCGLGFLDPRPTAEAYAAFYRDVYRPLVSAYHGRSIDSNTVQVDQRAYAAELVAWLGRVLPSAPSTTLDVGGSTGVVAAAVVEAFGGRATILDPSPDELAVARAAGMEVIAGFAEDYDPGERRSDLVLLCQTIDHLLDVRRTLAALRRSVATEGHVFVDALDVRFMLERRGTIEEVVKIDHPYYLTRHTGRALLAQAGLEVVAERLSHDGHWAFVTRPAEPREVGDGELRAHADDFLATIWRHRAANR
jgi:SAM-dependent methyltransferase